MPRTLLTDETWARLLPILKQHGVYGKSTLRNTVEGILYRIRVGCPWRDIPAEFGCHNSIYCTFRRRSAKNITDMILAQLCAQADMEWVCIDGSHIKVHQHAAGAAGGGCQAVGISRGGNTSKIHLATDACGNPVRLMLSAGNVNDITVAPQLVDGLDLSQCDTLIADKGYDSDVFR